MLSTLRKISAPAAIRRLPFFARANSTTSTDPRVAAVLATIRRRDGHETEFLQAVQEAVPTLTPLFERDPSMIGVFEKMSEPERVLSFSVRGFMRKFCSFVGTGVLVVFGSRGGGDIAEDRRRGRRGYESISVGKNPENRLRPRRGVERY